MSFFQIPGNIKQQFLPFVLNPKAALNETVGTSPELNSQCDPQYFSFKDNDKYLWSGKAKLNFFPSSIKSQHIDDDLSFKLLYGHDISTGQSKKSSITMQDIMNTVPAIQIREFLPDTRLDQCINMFTDLFKNMTKMFSSDDSENGGAGKNAKTKSEKIEKLYQKLMASATFTMKYMVGAYPNGAPSFLKDLGDISGTKFSSYKSSLFTGFGVGDYVMKFPYALYYRLQTSVTTGIYEVPAIITDKRILNSAQGTNGWTNGGQDFMSAGGLRLSGLLGKIPVVGTIANMILGNIGINYMPWWNAEQGTVTKEPEIDIKFDLYNDSAQAAMMNFIFVNTIVPNNKWLQYNMFQHSQHIYDVKIEGINRLFACAGDFNVSYEGVLRDPPKKWIENLVKNYANKNIDQDNFKDNILKNRLIKIPDVYRVNMKFVSLLPANFNNYIFAYADNNNHIDTYYTKVYDQSAVSEAFPKAVSKYSKRIAKVWDAGKQSAGNLDAKNENAGKHFNDSGVIVPDKE